MEKNYTTYFSHVFHFLQLFPDVPPHLPIRTMEKGRRRRGHGENRIKREGGEKQRTRGKLEEGGMEEGLISGPEVLSKIKS